MLKKINKWVLKIETTVAMAIVGVATASILLQVLFRYFLRSPFDWPEELAVFLLTWVTFIGASILLKRNEHICVSILLDRFPRSMKIGISIFMDLLVMVALGVMIYHSALLVPIQNVSSTVALHIPRGYFILPIVIASASMGLFMVQHARDLMDTFRKAKP